MAVVTYTKSGTKATTQVKLDKEVFDLEVTNHDLVKQAYVGYLANGRQNLAVVKTRGLVSGGGRKPWKQKGTGRARFGSSRNPIWRGGGIVFGPTGEENYTHKMTTSAKRTALRQALSLSKDSKIVIIESFECREGKVKPTLVLLEKLGATKKVLIVVSVKNILTERATRNLQNVQVVQARYLNVYDVMNADSIVIEKEALTEVHTWLGSPKKTVTSEDKK